MLNEAPMSTSRRTWDPSLRAYLSSIASIPQLDRATELVLARRWRRSGDRAAGDALVAGNLRFVVRLASRYRGYGIALADLVGEGNLGLLAALRNFDPRRKLRFLTYAAYWVRAYLLLYVQRQWSMVTVGRSPRQSRIFFRLRSARAALERTLGEAELSIDALLAEQFGVSEAHVRAMSHRLSAGDASLDAAPFPDARVALVDLLRDDRPSPEELAAGAERDAQVRRAVAALWPSLAPRTRVIGERMLLAPADGETLASVGRSLGISRERVRQINETVKAKLRVALAAL